MKEGQREGQREEGRHILVGILAGVGSPEGVVVVVHNHPDIRTAAGDLRTPGVAQGHLVGMAHHIHEVQEVEARVEVHLEEDIAQELGSHVDCEGEARYAGAPVRVGNNPVEGEGIGLKTQER